MKRVTRVVMLALGCVFLAGCEVRGPSLKIEPPRVKVDGVKVKSSGGGGFCPPGQAKKGNC